MANDAALTVFAAHPAQRLVPATLAFCVLLLLIFVGLQPFAPPAPVSAFGGVVETSRGDTLRQVAYLAVFALLGLSILQRRGLGLVGAVPPSLWLLLGWCMASALWAGEPGIAFRRAGLEVVVVLSIFFSVDILGAERALRIWRILLAAILVVNFLSIPLIATARHLPGEADAALVGNWRGLFGHKNIAGAVCAMTAILFLFTHNGRRNWIGIAIAIAAIAFLAMTRSKSSLGFLLLALCAGGLYLIGWRDGLSRAILAVTALLLLAAIATFLFLDADAVAHAIEDPAEFTGRSAIWVAELRYIADHPLLGAGFGTFADTGGLSPLHNYVSGSWVEAVSHGHNGYLQILVTIGGVGFALAMLALVLGPLAAFWRLDWEGGGFKLMCFSLFVFLVLHNVMESDFLEGDGVAWAGLLLVIAALRSRQRRGFG